MSEEYWGLSIVHKSGGHSFKLRGKIINGVVGTLIELPK